MKQGQHQCLIAQIVAKIDVFNVLNLPRTLALFDCTILGGEKKIKYCYIIIVFIVVRTVVLLFRK